MKKAENKYKKRTPNPYGICRCRHCSTARFKMRSHDSRITKIKRKQKRDWKSNKQAEKGAYPG